MHQNSFPSSPSHTTEPFQIVHSDVWGPAPHLSLDGYRYYVSFVDDFTRYIWLYSLRQKSDAMAAFAHFNKMVERQFTTPIKCLQTDWEENIKNSNLSYNLGILFRHPCPHTHQQEGRDGRKHRSIVEIGLTLLAQASMDLKFWWEAFLSVAYLLNRLTTSILQHITPFESLFGQKPNYHFLKVFCCACFPFLKPYNKNKFAFKTSKCLFLGYSPFHKGYRCLHPSSRIYIGRSVTFDERFFPYQSMFNSGPFYLHLNLLPTTEPLPLYSLL